MTLLKWWVIVSKSLWFSNPKDYKMSHPRLTREGASPFCWHRIYNAKISIHFPIYPAKCQRGELMKARAEAALLRNRCKSSSCSSSLLSRVGNEAPSAARRLCVSPCCHHLGWSYCPDTARYLQNKHENFRAVRIHKWWLSSESSDLNIIIIYIIIFE